MAKSTNVVINLIDPDSPDITIGKIAISEGKNELIFTPDLNSISPGSYAIAIYQNASCAPRTRDGQVVAGLAAGEILKSKKGNIGELSKLIINNDGSANNIKTKNFKSLSEVQNHAIIIHEQKYLDIYGSRMACGVIK